MVRSGANGAPVTVTLLGTGDAFASFGRSQSGYLIDAPAGRILMEAGPGLMQALKGRGVSTDSFDLLLISHLHGDHFGGLPFLILDYMWETRRKKALTIAGPAKLEERTWSLMRTMFPHFELDKIKHKLKFVVLEPGSSTRLGKFKVSAIRSPHTKPDISLSLRVDGGGKSIVFSGDSGWNDELVDFSDGRRSVPVRMHLLRERAPEVSSQLSAARGESRQVQGAPDGADASRARSAEPRG